MTSRLLANERITIFTSPKRLLMMTCMLLSLFLCVRCTIMSSLNSFIYLLF